MLYIKEDKKESILKIINSNIDLDKMTLEYEDYMQYENFEIKEDCFCKTTNSCSNWNGKGFAIHIEKQEIGNERECQIEYYV